MKSKKKVEDLENEIQKLRLKVTNLEERLKITETFINNVKNNNNFDTVNPLKIPTELNNNNNNSDVSIPVLSNANSTQSVNRPNQPTLINITPPLNENPDNENDSTNIDIDTDQNNQIEEPTKKSTIESWIGKNLMGAVASFLVFIALIIFAKLFMPYLTDTIKIVLMFVASITLTAVGFFFNKKKPENTFYKALLGCGSACIYLSILVTGVHFKAISSIVMYVLIALWAVLIIFFKKNKNDWLFFAIGNLGYFVSIIFTTGLNDKSLIIPVLIYVLMISLVYQIMYWKNEYQRYSQNIINILSLLLFQIIMITDFGKLNEVIIVGIASIAFSSIGFIGFTIYDIFNYKRMHFYIAASNTIVYLIAYFLLIGTIKFEVQTNIILSFIAIIIPAIILELVNMYWRIKNLAKNDSIINAIYSGFLFYMAVFIISVKDSFLFHSGIILIAYSLIVIYGIIKKDLLFKVQGWALICLCLLIEVLKNNTPFIIVAAIILLSLFIIEGIVLNDSEFFKILSYIVLLVWIARIGHMVYTLNKTTINYDILLLVTYGIMGLINLIMILTKYYNTKDKDKEDKEGRNIRFVLDVFNLMFIIFGVLRMNYLTNDKFKAIYMVIVFILACINIPLKDKGNRERYIYTALKFAFLIFDSLYIFNTPKYVISICMIAFSVVCITIGFKNKLVGKELRIFGLVMTLFFVVKFIVVDISYNNSVLKALGYLISGILCFGISAIYNYFEKKQGRNTLN